MKIINSIAEKRKYVRIRDKGICRACGSSINAYDYYELGHIVSNKKYLRSQYGDKIIDCTDNVGLTCSGKCNKYVDLGSIPSYHLKAIIIFESYNSEEEKTKLLNNLIKDKKGEFHT